MTDKESARQKIHDELDRVRADFAELITRADDETLARPSDGTRWTNRQLLFHMLFGYLITRNLRPVVKVVSRLRPSARRAFAAGLDSATRPFHVINYWGACVGACVVSPGRMNSWMNRVIAALKNHLDKESEAALRKSMPFPPRWDPYFTSDMTLLSVYHYASVHYDHHRAQLTLGG